MENSSQIPGLWYQRLAAFVWFDCIVLLYTGIIALLNEISTSPPRLDIENVEKRTGQVAIITGGPRGLALGLIKRLVQMDYTIIMAVRNIEDSKKRLAVFANANKDLRYDKIKLLKMDLNVMNSVRSFAKQVLRETSRIDLLLCNAAIMKAPYEITVDGYESQFQVNYLSNFLLTNLLLQRLKETSVAKEMPCQIIYTSSVVSRFARFNPDELENPAVYTPFKFYFPSKLYPVMSMLHMQRKLQQEDANVFLYAVHPGLIPTDLWFTGSFYLIGRVGQLMKNMFRTLENGADTILWPILSKDFTNIGGLYMESGTVIDVSDQAKNKDVQAVLYTKSLKLAGIGDT